MSTLYEDKQRSAREDALCLPGYVRLQRFALRVPARQASRQMQPLQRRRLLFFKPPTILPPRCRFPLLERLCAFVPSILVTSSDAADLDEGCVAFCVKLVCRVPSPLPPGGFQPAGHLVADSLCYDMEMPSKYRGPCARQILRDFVFFSISVVSRSL